MTSPDSGLDQRLDRLGEVIRSRQSLAGRVMNRIELAGPALPRGRRRLGGKLMRSTMGLAACIVIAVALWGMFSPTSTPRAYGIEDVPARMLAVDSLYVRGSLYFSAEEARGVEAVEVPLEYYVQRPRRYWMTTVARDDTVHTGYCASDGRRYINVDHKSRTCTLGNDAPLAAELQTANSFEVLLPQQFLGGKPSEYTRTGTRELEAGRVDVYERRLSFPEDSTTLRHEVWLDPTTGLPVRAAIYRSDKPDGTERLRVELREIAANIDPPAELFTFEPPAGYAVKYHDRQPDEIRGGGGSARAGDAHCAIRFMFNLNDRGILVCWAFWNTSESSYLEPNLDGPTGRQLSFPELSSTDGRRYTHHFLRADEGAEFHWRWSLIVPTDAMPISNDVLKLTFRSEYGMNSFALTPLRCHPDRLGDLVMETQKLTLPEDAPADAPMSLEELELLIADIHRGQR